MSEDYVAKWIKAYLKEVKYNLTWWYTTQEAKIALWWKVKRERLKDHKRALKRWADKRDGTGYIVVFIITSLAWAGGIWAW